MVSGKYALRKSMLSLKKTLSLLPLIIVGTAFFVILFTIVSSYKTTALKYFNDYNYADYTLYGEFDSKVINNLTDSEVKAEGRHVVDYKLPDKTMRAISVSDDINSLFLYDGNLEIGINDCLMLERNAKALNKGVGDSFNINGKDYKISGLVASPEYVYLVKDEKSVMNQANKFVVVYITEENFTGTYNEILIKSNNVLSEDFLLKSSGARLALSQKEQINYTLYESDLSEIFSFAYIFPVLFLIVIGVIIFVILKRTVAQERKSIATMKALGAGNGKITLIYLTQFILVAVLGVAIGCLVGMLLTNFIITLFSDMFVVPNLKFVFYPLIWLIALLIMLGVTFISGLISLIGIFKLEPAAAMRPSNNTKSKRILFEKTKVWSKLSFNTRYALRNTMRNKGRFFASVTAIAFSLALLILSSGFIDSINGTKQAFFEETANYDYIVSTEFLPYLIDDEVIAHCGENYAKALEISQKIDGEQIPIKIVDKDFNMIRLPKSIDSGVVIPTYFADKWNVKKGDSIKIGLYDYVISDIAPQYVGLTVYTSFNYASSVDSNFKAIYNSIYIKGSPNGLLKYLNESNRFFVTINDDASVFDNVAGSVRILTLLMTACAVILGIFALYSIGLINLSSREHEYAQLNALGYSEGKILLTQFKETVLQFLLALPIGLFGGNLLLYFIKGEFSNQSFCLKPTIYFPSYLFAIGIIVLLLGVITLVAIRQIKKINIVEKLKSNE